MLKVFAGYDPRVPEGFDVFRHSVEYHASEPVAVIPLNQEKLRQQGVYWRPPDERASTPFSLTRFLVPYLCDYEGYALFVDGSDMLCTTDIVGILDVTIDDPKPRAVWCTQHEYIPIADPKFFGAPQHKYPRKNWSSCMLFDCSECEDLTVEAVNAQDPSWLHQMQWVNRWDIGALAGTWNWLAGEPDFEWAGIDPPAIIHYTLGLPVVPDALPTEFDGLWYAERDHLRARYATTTDPVPA
jgi:hypothetical protein